MIAPTSWSQHFSSKFADMDCGPHTRRDGIDSDTMLSELHGQWSHHALDSRFRSIINGHGLHRCMKPLRRNGSNEYDTAWRLRFDKMFGYQLRRPHCAQYIDIQDFATHVPGCFHKWLIDADSSSGESAVQLSPNCVGYDWHLSRINILFHRALTSLSLRRRMRTLRTSDL